MTKHLLHNEKFIKWFFARVKQNNYHIIDILKNEHDVSQKTFDEFLRITSRYYQTLYVQKFFDKNARNKILDVITNKIIFKVQANLIKMFNAKDIENFVHRATLKKSFDDDDFQVKLYKSLIKWSKKMKKDDFKFKFTVFIKRLLAMYN